MENQKVVSEGAGAVTTAAIWSGKYIPKKDENIDEIFDYIDQEKQANKKWSELPSKAEDVYIPLLNAFVNEIKKESDIDDYANNLLTLTFDDVTHYHEKNNMFLFFICIFAIITRIS